MWELDHKESWVPKNRCFWTVVLEKTLESPLDGKENKPVNSKENQPWIFIGRIEPEAEAPILWPSEVKNWLIRKDPDSGKDWRQEEKRMAEDKMVGWHHQWDMRLCKLRELLGSEGQLMDRWWTVKPGVPGVSCLFVRQRVGHDWATWTELNWAHMTQGFSSWFESMDLLTFSPCPWLSGNIFMGEYSNYSSFNFILIRSLIRLIRDHMQRTQVAQNVYFERNEATDKETCLFASKRLLRSPNIHSE